MNILELLKRGAGVVAGSGPFGQYAPAPVSARTPSFLPPQPGDVDPFYEAPVDSTDSADPLQEELISILRAQQKPTKRRKFANVLRAGLGAAATPNRAHGGPMDMLAALAGGMDGMEDATLRDEDVFNKRQDRAARNVGAIMEQERRKQTALAQIAASNARVARENAQRKKIETSQPKRTWYSTSDGLYWEKPDGTGAERVPGQAPPKTPVTEAEKIQQEIETRRNAMLNELSMMQGGGDTRDQDEQEYLAARYAGIPVTRRSEDRPNRTITFRDGNTTRLITLVPGEGGVPVAVPVKDQDKKPVTGAIPQRTSSGGKPTQTKQDRDEFNSLMATTYPAGIPDDADDDDMRVIVKGLLGRAQREGKTGAVKVIKSMYGDLLGIPEVDLAPPSSKTGASKKLTKEKAREYYRANGNDKAKAEAAAKRDGYTW